MKDRCDWCDEEWEINERLYSHFLNKHGNCVVFPVQCPDCKASPCETHFVTSDLFFGGDCEVEYVCGKTLECKKEERTFGEIKRCKAHKEPVCLCPLNHYGDDGKTIHDDDCEWNLWRKGKK